MTQYSSLDNSYDPLKTISKAPTLLLFFYFLSFVLVWATIAFITTMYLMDYEDGYSILGWVTEKWTDKISSMIFYISQFPLGLLYGLLTGNYYNGLFAFLLNPLLIGWTLYRFLFKGRHIIIKRTLQVNLIIWLVLVLTMTFFIVT